MSNAVIGMRIRERRKALGITQSDLARRINISPSYLNLIERNKRGIAGKVLNDVVAELGMQLKDIDGSSERHFVNELAELTADPLMEALALDPRSAVEFMGRYPKWARALVLTYRSLQEKSDAVTALSDRLNHDPFLGDAVHNMLTNIAALRSTSDILVNVDNIDPEQQHRFFGILSQESARLSEVGESLAAFFDKSHTEAQTVGPVEEVDAFLREHNNYFAELERGAEKQLSRMTTEHVPSDRDLLAFLEELEPQNTENKILSEDLVESRRFKLARRVASLLFQNEIDSILAAFPGTVSATTTRRLRSGLASYGAAAILMPYDLFLNDAKELQYDIERLQRRYHTSFEQTCHRLSTLRCPGNEGIPFAFVRAGPAGHITKRLALPRLSLPRYGAACPLWILYRAFLRPERLTRQFVEFPNGDQFLFIAKAIPKGDPGFGLPRNYMSVMLACDINHGDKTIYDTGPEYTLSSAAEPVGPNCRICPREECQHRADDPILGG
jgi:predicted transcriptional regulator/transcriptional regulator with XRE-family HTH domain